MAPLPPRVAGQKRKAGPETKNGSSLMRKRQKGRDAKAIPSQPATAALSATGELNIAAFVKAREFEINALDRSMQKAKKGLTARAFQGVPRSMRRRTASHNAKKVPKRLRPRAEREMKEDNTPTVTARRRAPSKRLRLRMQTVKMIQNWSKKSKTIRKKKAAKLNKEPDPENHVLISRIPRIKKNTLMEPPKATSKFKKRQVRKAWLPTHLWHAKRARMTKPTEPLWRMAIPLSPTEKSYRPTHRAGGSRGCIAWDMSYMSTIGCRGIGLSLENMLKGIGFNGEGWSGAKYKRWRQGTRSAEGWTFEKDNDRRPITPVNVIWYSESPKSTDIPGTGPGKSADIDSKDVPMSDVAAKESTKKKASNSRLMIRVHPSAFHQFWIELLKVAKLQRPQVLVEDLRFEIGSIEITGPGSTEALLGVLEPAKNSDSEDVCFSGKTWTALAGLNNPASLPPNCLLSLIVEDPRLHHPPKQVKIPKDSSDAAALTELMLSWPPDQHPTGQELFSHKSRYVASRSLQSQKAINRRRAEATPGQPLPSTDRDPKIPVILLASRLQSGQSNGQGSWTVLLPWKCVDPVWRSLVYYPFTSGGVPRFGGLDEKRQLVLEHGQAWFPGDMPGTEAGKAWERTQTEERFDEWSRRPPSRRVTWQNVDLGNGAKGEHGNGWACDWEFLFGNTAKPPETAEVEGGPVEVADSSPSNFTEPPSSKALTQRQRKAEKDKQRVEKEEIAEKEARRRNTSSPESDIDVDQASIKSELVPLPQFMQTASGTATSLFNNVSIEKMPKSPSLASVRITFLTRGTPNPCARIYRLPSYSTPEDAETRKQWLALDPTNQDPAALGAPKQKTSYNPTARLPKDKLNRHGLPRTPSALPLDNADHIHYLPPDAPPAVVAQYGPKPTAAPDPVAEERAALLAKLLNPNTTAEERDKHPPCPNVGDLIGFVTTGAYNLAEGRGMAVGGIWVQRVLEGWMRDESEVKEPKERKRRDRERRLCVVRNAGEGVGRLAVWEIC